MADSDTTTPEEGDSPANRRAKYKGFLPESLDRTVIAIPLLERIKAEKQRMSRNAKEQGTQKWQLYDVIIDLNLTYPGGRPAARARIERMVAELTQAGGGGISKAKSRLSTQYLFASLSAPAIEALVRSDADPVRDEKAKVDPEAVVGSEGHALYRIWPDELIQRLTTKTVSTIKADAAHNAFSALGDGIVWAVLDSGIDGTHAHFAMHRNLDLVKPVRHMDFTQLESEGQPLVDVLGHGTHVAGVIAGECVGSVTLSIRAETRFRDETGEPQIRPTYPDRITGMAPRAKLVSMKVLNDDGSGNVSSLLAALEAIQELNGYGRRLLIHGVNMSVGYDFEPEWFACGQSPLCVEVDRLVRSGVSVVVAAGNTGYGWMQTSFRGAVSAGLDLTINDPGNAEMAITVGSTHREMPHTYGVSYFSSKGPTGDGRLKPDLLAPGEKIISAASSGGAAVGLVAPAEPPPPLVDAGTIAPVTAQEAGLVAAAANSATPPRGIARYREDSGTSMAAPHVSGAIAAFLSVRREFIGRAELVKQIFLDSATDLKRERSFQGRGLVDLMRALQSV